MMRLPLKKRVRIVIHTIKSAPPSSPVFLKAMEINHIEMLELLIRHGDTDDIRTNSLILFEAIEAILARKYPKVFLNLTYSEYAKIRV